LQNIFEFVGRHLIWHISIIGDSVYGSAFLAAVGSTLIFAIIYKWARVHIESSMQQLKSVADNFASGSETSIAKEDVTTTQISATSS
jgi:hypothetical protein